MATHAQKIELNGQPREILGSRVKQLRNEGFVPAVLYGKGLEPISLQIQKKDFEKTLKLAGESTLVYLNVDGKSYPTIIHDVTRDPLKDSVLHADFYKVRLDEKIKTKIPVVFMGESPAVKSLGGIFVRNVNELEVEALPQNLPHEITIDISKMDKIGDQVLIRDLKLGSDVVVMAESDDIIALVQEPISEEELKKQLEGETKAADEVEVIGEKEKAEKEAAEAAIAEGEPAKTIEKKEEK